MNLARQRSPRFATSSFAIRPEFLARLAVQTFGIRLVGAGLGDRFLVARTRGGYRATLACWGGSGALRQASS